MSFRLRRLRAWRSRRVNRGTAAAARAGVASHVDGAGDAVREAQFVRSNQNHHLGVLRGGASLTEEIAGWAGKIREAWEAGEHAGLLVVEQSSDDGGFFFSDAYGLGNRAVGDNGYAVDARAGEGANLKFQLQSDFVVGMNGGRSFDLNAEIFVLRSGVGLLRDASPRVREQARGTQDYRDLTSGA